MKENFWGLAVRCCRKQRGMSILHTSRLAGLFPLTLYLIECGRIPLRLKEFVKISKAFDSTPVFLLYEINEIMPPRPNKKENWLC